MQKDADLLPEQANQFVFAENHGPGFCHTWRQPVHGELFRYLLVMLADFEK